MMYRIISIIILLPAFYTQLRAQDKILIKNIEYDVPICNQYSYNITGIEEVYSDWWDRNIEPSKRIPFLKSILNKAESGAVKVYDDKDKLLTTNDIYKILYLPDTVSYQNVLPPFDIMDTVILSRIYYDDIQYLRFQEQWFYDVKTFKIEKQIIKYSPVWVEFDQENKKSEKTKALFWIKCNNSNSSTFKPLTELIRYNLSWNKNINTGSFIKPKSISNDSVGRKQYIDSLNSAIENGKINIYECSEMEDYYNYDTDKLLPLSKSDAHYRYYEIDTLTFTHTEPPYDEYDSVIVWKLDVSTMGSMFVEKWLIDDVTLEMRKEVQGIDYYIWDYYFDGELKGIKPIFYLSFGTPKRLFD